LGGSLEDYRAAIKAGMAQLHAFSDGFAITEVRDYTNPPERVLNVLLLGGKRFDGWKAEADLKLVSFARVNGCNAIEFACRLGLAKKIRGLGYTEKRKLMRKDLRHEQTILEDRRLRAAA
jgi:hypothetical protein